MLKGGTVKVAMVKDALHFNVQKKGMHKPIRKVAKKKVAVAA